ncbi:GNAT family N-acetyltransferase [Luteipulveratus halotolerans]|uniref:GCN5 family acetyltransferase n=1 Tax=Luteipulveratus halotolerans TaxID=1631356 RepID=A0A0L6CDW8_9MICO|nr:GNAT family N-acetyltransferase [Luteipulveratus halotolerans]KNX35987.1 GCN5 family acetyltransferase [Luteipulveratus halotolerans]
MTRPVLRTTRLRLEPLGDEHLDHLVELDGDPEVMRFLTGRARTRAQVEALQPARTDPAFDQAGIGFWVGFDGDMFIGWWLLTTPDGPEFGGPESVEIGYRLMRAQWRRGYAAEGARELLRYVFEDTSYTRVYADTMAVNVGSRGVMEKIGMAYERTYYATFEHPLPGTEQGEVIYAITREGWTASRSR